MLNGERSADSKNIEAVKVASRNFEMGWVHDVYIFASRMCYIMHVGAMSVEQGMYIGGKMNRGKTCCRLSSSESLISDFKTG